MKDESDLRLARMARIRELLREAWRSVLVQTWCAHEHAT